jgi:hypothetical protein
MLAQFGHNHTFEFRSGLRLSHLELPPIAMHNYDSKRAPESERHKSIVNPLSGAASGNPMDRNTLLIIAAVVVIALLVVWSLPATPPTETTATPPTTPEQTPPAIPPEQTPPATLPAQPQ